eukprot:TRINITY_DN14036_c0_g1_i1.p1 TRINITY_DN14036_c0_g1~~TRINITY_DN14036_c0_g1_i1.p1  ORF type:complete len:197 (-),score=28.58 TRINITY_DN14036_c0_g1_i1:427-1017(-)
MNIACRRFSALLRRQLLACQERTFSQETISSIKPKDEFWSVDGQVVRIQNGAIIRNKEEHELIANPKPMNQKKIRLARIKRAADTKIRPGRIQTTYWDCYVKNLQASRTAWEKLNDEGPPDLQVAVNHNLQIDHHKILGLDRRHEPFTIDQLKRAFRRKAKLYHPESTGKYTASAALKFRQIFNSYKVLSTQRNRM